ncbi:MAG: hypothetical protein ACFCBW_23210, partial [Candidatus Competibacterales bacterium]
MSSSITSPPATSSPDEPPAPFPSSAPPPRAMPSLENPPPAPAPPGVRMMSAPASPYGDLARETLQDGRLDGADAARALQRAADEFLPVDSRTNPLVDAGLRTLQDAVEDGRVTAGSLGEIAGDAARTLAPAEVVKAVADDRLDLKDAAALGEAWLDRATGTEPAKTPATPVRRALAEARDGELSFDDGVRVLRAALDAHTDEAAKESAEYFVAQETLRALEDGEVNIGELSRSAVNAVKTFAPQDDPRAATAIRALEGAADGKLDFKDSVAIVTKALDTLPTDEERTDPGLFALRQTLDAVKDGQVNIEEVNRATLAALDEYLPADSAHLNLAKNIVKAAQDGELDFADSANLVGSALEAYGGEEFRDSDAFFAARTAIRAIEDGRLDRNDAARTLTALASRLLPDDIEDDPVVFDGLRTLNKLITEGEIDGGDLQRLSASAVGTVAQELVEARYGDAAGAIATKAIKPFIAGTTSALDNANAFQAEEVTAARATVNLSSDVLSAIVGAPARGPGQAAVGGTGARPRGALGGAGRRR